MSIRVQCGGCGSVMSVRDEYAGTERRCPKCKGKFHVPTAAEAAASGSSEKSIAGDDFDPVAFLTGETPLPGTPKVAGKPKSAAPAAKQDEFDPLDVLTGGAAPKGGSSPATPVAPKGKPATAPPATPPAAAPPEFDPLDVLSGETKPAPPVAAKAAAAPPPVAPAPPAPAAPAPPAPASAQPEKPQPRKPSWAKAPPPKESNDWDDPPQAAAPAPPPAPPEKPQPKRPSWAKAGPAAEVNDWDDPPPATASAPAAEAPPAAPQPKRPSWAKPLPGEAPQPAATAATAVAADASPAAQAAAAAMGATIAAVSADNPAFQQEQPKEPWINPAAIVAGFKRRIPLMLKTLATSLALFAGAWWFVQPGRIVWSQIGGNQKLQLVPVAGRITVDGKPVANARVMFHPRGPQFRSPEGRTDGDGQFQLQFCEGYTGAPPGRYRVQLQVINKDGSDGGSNADALLQDQTFDVPAEGGTVDVVLDTKPKAAG